MGGTTTNRLRSFFYLPARGDRAGVSAVERVTYRAAVDVVLVSPIALAFVHTGTFAEVRGAMTLRELEAAVAAPVESPVRMDVHSSHLTLELFPRSRASLVRAALAAAVRDLAALADALLVHEICAFEHDKSGGAAETHLADQVRIHCINRLG